ncbi:heparinase II/III domain-containing protein [Brevifollis gellanilyticus]|uniref:Uncharacterized protein n=1 Tax=Brevifollis gellanilyticus TaxID=748831 RepID=A0A512MA19_9BACT|nr:heparinase II/III family protein [Brevifollis gellanilyticus]GEP43181.1 hypothetical protein BGE01nite_24720 [Brevifollis gellanilyticus]
MVFEPGPVDDKVPRLPDRATAPVPLRIQLSADAKNLILGSWRLFGWKDVEVGAPPCWHRDPVCGVVISHDRPADKIDYRRLPDGADARSIWEINRWAEMTRLAMHGWLNDDANAIRTAQLWLEDWTERNPAGIGINWTSPLEAALRLINFTWFDAIVSAWSTEQAVRGRTLRDHQTMLRKRIVPVHAAWVWRHRSTGSSANNHLLGELAALVVAVSRWPGVAKVSCSADTAWDLLGREVLRQFAPDGGSYEQALHYHAFALDLAWQAARAVGCKAGEVHQRLALAARFLLALGHGTEPWDFGDSDDAAVVPLTLSRDQAAEETRAWLLGEDCPLRWWMGDPPVITMNIPTAGLTVHEWQPFPTSGYAGLRSHGWAARLDASPLGLGSLAAHGHGDALHVSVWDGPHALLIDPGTGGYHGHAELRTELAAWKAHNGPLPDPAGFKTPRRIGPFLQIQHHPVPKMIVEGSTAMARFEHEGYKFQRQVRRHEDHLEIRDTEDYRKPFSVTWTLPPGTEVKALPSATDTSFILTRAGKSWLMSLQVADAKISVEERRVSPAYARIETAKVIMVRQIKAGLATKIQRLG